MRTRRLKNGGEEDMVGPYKITVQNGWVVKIHRDGTIERLAKMESSLDGGFHIM
jgi:hypothetical protein